jgi:hypothetical protein
MAGLTGSASCRIDKGYVPALTAFFIENDAGHAFVLYAERAARSLDFTGLLSRMSFSVRKNDPVAIGIEYTASGVVAPGTTALGVVGNSTGATLYGTGCYMTFGTGAPANGTTLNVEEMDFEIVRELFPDDYFDSGNAIINWKRYSGGMYHIIGRARGPMIAGAAFSVGTTTGAFGTAHSAPGEGYEIQLVNSLAGTDGTYTFAGVNGEIGYDQDKKGRTIVEVVFESSYTATTPDVVVVQPIYGT